MVAIHVRDRARPKREVRKLVERMASICVAGGALCIVNRLVEVAGQLETGLHLGKAHPQTATIIEGARARGVQWLSLSAHTDDDVDEAMGHQPSALVVSPIFATRSGALTNEVGEVSLKAPRGPSALHSAAARTLGKTPLVALGGIDPRRARECFDCGATAVAAMSHWLEEPIERVIDAWAQSLQNDGSTRLR
jgi:thiamine-phosphate pyrophosphorylase